MAVETCTQLTVWLVLVDHSFWEHPHGAFSLFTFQSSRCLAVLPIRRLRAACILPGSHPGSRAFSSGGQSARLITVRSVVRVHKGPPAPWLRKPIAGM